MSDFVAFPIRDSNEHVRVNISEISSYRVYDKYRPGDGSIVRLKDGSVLHVSCSCAEIDQSIDDVVRL